MDAAAPARSGVYGKIPALGDFVRRHLPLSFVEPWDSWLQHGLESTRRCLGDHWLDRYLSGPFWRFVLSPGVAGDAPVAGVLMPSVDAANRHFPLTIAAVLADAPPGPFAILPGCGSWFDAAERLALACLDEHFRIADLEAGLVALGRPAPDPPAAIPVPVQRRGDRLLWSLPADGGADAALAVLPDLVHGVCRDRFGGYSLFWTAGSDAVEPVLSLGAGLPREDGFVALFDDSVADAAGSVRPLPGKARQR